MRHVALIALGSNLGDRAATMRAALGLLADAATAVGAVSGFIETASVGGPADAPPYLNAVAVLQTGLEPLPLLARLMEVERTLGRRRPSVPAAPRTIDLDLLVYDDLVLDDPRLTLPHPRMHLRRFVLDPLAQVAPDWRHPVLGRTARELLMSLPRD